MTAPAKSNLVWLLLLALLAGGLVVGATGDTGPSTPAERARAVGQTIKCPQCLGQSVVDSDATAARQIRTEISRRIGQGETDREIRDFLSSKYGEEILLTPSAEGVTGLIWFLPVVAFVLAIGGLALTFRRWRSTADLGVTAQDQDIVDRYRAGAER